MGRTRRQIARALAAAGLALAAQGVVAEPTPRGPVTAATMGRTPPVARIGEAAQAPARSLRPEPRRGLALPDLAWQDAAGAPAWNAAVAAGLAGPGRRLLDTVPADIRAWCPAYPGAGPADRAAFWAGLVSILAHYESTHDPRAVGGGGAWFGLVQIAPATARGHGCQAGSGAALLDGPANLRCGLRIMARTVTRDGVVAAGMGGVAADWGPFHRAEMREGMRGWLRRQPYCVPGTRPGPRPAALGRAEGEPVPRPGLGP